MQAPAFGGALTILTRRHKTTLIRGIIYNVTLGGCIFVGVHQLSRHVFFTGMVGDAFAPAGLLAGRCASFAMNLSLPPLKATARISLKLPFSGLCIFLGRLIQNVFC